MQRQSPNSWNISHQRRLRNMKSTNSDKQNSSPTKGSKHSWQCLDSSASTVTLLKKTRRSSHKLFKVAAPQDYDAGHFARTRLLINCWNLLGHWNYQTNRHVKSNTQKSCKVQTLYMPSKGITERTERKTFKSHQIWNYILTRAQPSGALYARGK